MDIYFILVGLFALVWLYAFFAVLTGEFHNSTNKIVWIIVLIFLPISAILFPFIGIRQTVNGGGKLFAYFFTTIIFVGGFFLLVLAAMYLGPFINKTLGINLQAHFGWFASYIPTIIVFIPVTAVLMYFDRKRE